MTTARFILWCVSMTALPVSVGMASAAPTTVAPIGELPASIRVERVEFGRADPKLAKSNRVRVSRDFALVAYLQETGAGGFIVLNGTGGPGFPSVGPLDFAPVGHRWNCEVGVGENQEAMVVDGEQGPPFARAELLIWSDDGRHYVFRVQRAEDGAWALVTDGRVGKFESGRIAELAISPDGTHQAFVREDENGRARLAFYDGRRVAENATGFPAVPFRWSADGSTLAWVEKRDRESVLIVDGVERTRGARIDPKDLVLARGGRHFAAKISLADGRSAVVHDDKRYGPYRMLWREIALSPDGRRVAFAATLDDERAHAVIDGVPGPAAANRFGVTNVQFSADGRGVAYVREVSAGESAIHVGERTIAAPPGVAALWLSPDATRTAWLIRSAAGARVVLDGRGSEPVFRDVEQDDAAFTPDGRDFVYLATRDRKSYTVRLAGVGERTYELAVPSFDFPAPATIVFVTYDAGVFYRETWMLPR